MTEQERNGDELGSVIQRRDMYFHEPRYRDYRWFETNWFTWTIPQEAMRGHMRAGFRTNLGVVESTCFVFNNPDSHAGPLGVLYSDRQSHVPMPVTNLDHYDLVSGLSVRMTQPLSEWEVRYEGGHDTSFDLHYRSMMPPLHISETGTDEVKHATIHHGHIDQMMHVTGTVRVRGVEYEVNWAAPRDHSWSSRPESSSGYGFPMSGNFDYGSFGEGGQDFTFFVQTRNAWKDLRQGVVHNGYIIDGGDLLRIKSGEGRYTYEESDWVIKALTYEIEDERGRTHIFEGVPRSFYGSGAGTLAAVEWRNRDGETGWGEYNWHGDVYELQRIGRPPQ
ncbi:hypothetical protein MK489_24350 [Myxococcota bacterium]|nr:hypothetical protein [Myxococcota bacterium]